MKHSLRYEKNTLSLHYILLYWAYQQPHTKFFVVPKLHNEEKKEKKCISHNYNTI